MNKFSLPQSVLVILLGLSILGPAAPASAAINIWTSTGFSGGVTTTLVIAPNNPNTLYLAAPTAGIFKSTNNGGSWVSINTNLPATGYYGYAIEAIVVSPTDSQVVYVSTPAIFKTSNGGANWVPANTGIPGEVTSIPVLTIDPTNPAILYACTSVGVFKTVDSGDNWNLTNTGLPVNNAVSALVIDPLNPSTAYASTQGSGVYMTTDGGALWSSTNIGFPASRSIDNLTIDPTNPATLYATDYDPQTHTSIVFKSTDHGGSWNLANNGLEISYLYIYQITVDPKNSSTLYAGTNSHAYQSTDGGSHWIPLNPNIAAIEVYAIVNDPVLSTTIYAATSQGVYKTTNGGGNWNPVNTGFSSLWALDLIIDPVNSNNLYVRTSVNGLYKSIDHGQTWIVMKAEDFSHKSETMAIDPKTPSTLYIGADPGLFKSTNSGDTWTLMANELSNMEIYALAIDPQTPSILYASANDPNKGRSIYKSTDSGESFVYSSSDIDNSSYGNITKIVIDPITPSTVYAGDFTYNTPYSGVFKSIDGGLHWNSFNEGMSIIPNISVFELDPQNHTTLYVGGTFHGWVGGIEGRYPALYKRMQGGTWNMINTGFPVVNSFVRALAIDPNMPTTMYVSLQPGGVYQSTNGGATWRPFNAGLPTSWTTDLKIDPSDSAQIFVGTMGFGLFSNQSVTYRQLLPAINR